MDSRGTKLNQTVEHFSPIEWEIVFEIQRRTEAFPVATLIRLFGDKRKSIIRTVVDRLRYAGHLNGEERDGATWYTATPSLSDLSPQPDQPANVTSGPNGVLCDDDRVLLYLANTFDDKGFGSSDVPIRQLELTSPRGPLQRLSKKGLITCQGRVRSGLRQGNWYVLTDEGRQRARELQANISPPT